MLISAITGILLIICVYYVATSTIINNKKRRRKYPTNYRSHKRKKTYHNFDSGTNNDSDGFHLFGDDGGSDGGGD